MVGLREARGKGSSPATRDPAKGSWARPVLEWFKGARAGLDAGGGRQRGGAGGGMPTHVQRSVGYRSSVLCEGSPGASPFIVDIQPPPHMLLSGQGVVEDWTGKLRQSPRHSG